MQQTITTATAPDFAALLEQATTEPGRLSAAYTAFHTYSMGNMLLAMFQCETRGIPLGPIATFPRWKELGRYVRKGEKGILITAPVIRKRDPEDEDVSDLWMCYPHGSSGPST